VGAMLLLGESGGIAYAENHLKNSKTIVLLGQIANVNLLKFKQI